MSPLVPALGYTTFTFTQLWFLSTKQVWPTYASQETVPCQTLQCALSALLHYNMDIPSVICFSGNNYTGAYRNVPQILKTVQSHIPLETYKDLKQILTVGTLTVFNEESSCKNYNECQRYRITLLLQNMTRRLQRSSTRKNTISTLWYFPHGFKNLLATCTPHHSPWWSFLERMTK